MQVMSLNAEGTRELRPQYEPLNRAAAYITTRNKKTAMASYIADSLNRLYVSIADTSETIYFGFGHATRSGQISLNEYLPADTSSWVDSIGYRLMDPDGLVVMEGLVPLEGQGFIGDSSLEAYNRCVNGPQQLVSDSGYWALSYKPEKTGNYYIAVKDLKKEPKKLLFQLFDVTVGSSDMQLIKGRLWSYKWLLLSYGEGQNFETMHPFEGKIYAYSGDQVVTEIEFVDFRPWEFVVYCNSVGTNVDGSVQENRQSINGSGNALPEYPLFLNPPDSSLFPTGELSCVKALSSVYQCNSETYYIQIETTRNGYANVFLDIDRDGIYNAEDRDVMFDMVSVNANEVNLIEWDGNDNLGDPVPVNDSIPIVAYMVAGVTHFPAHDVERCGGLNIRLIRPHFDCSGNPLDSVLMYWDDSRLDGTTELNGCLDFCRSWEINEKTNNTWWYIINEKTQAYFVVRDTALLIQLDTTLNPIGYFEHGDTLAVNVFYRKDQFVASDLLDSLKIEVLYPDRYSLEMLTFDSSDINEYTGHLRIYWTLNNLTGQTIYDLHFNVMMQGQYCDGFEQIRQLGEIQAEWRTSDVSCFGMQDGEIEIYNVQGGTEKYIYSVNGGQQWFATGSFENLNAGFYQLVVQNMLFPELRWEADSIEIKQPPSMSLAILVDSVEANALIERCESDSFRVAEASFSEDVSTFFWITPKGDTLHDETLITLFDDGMYQLFVFNENSCQQSLSIQMLTHPNPFWQWGISNPDTVYAAQTNVFSLTSQESVLYEWQVSAFGSISGIPIGHEVEVEWEDIAFVQSFVIAKGTHIETGCEWIDSFRVVLEPTPPVAIDYFNILAPESCPDENDGWAEWSVSGGKGNIVFELQKDGVPFFDTLLKHSPVLVNLNNLSAGYYQARAFALGVETYVNGTVPLASVAYDIEKKSHLLCEGDTARWEVYLEYPASISWINQMYDTISNTQQLNTSVPGVYYAHIAWTDRCFVEEQAIVSHPDLIAVEAYVGEKAYCPDICDGIIGMRVLHGVVSHWEFNALFHDDRQVSSSKYRITDCCAGYYELLAMNSSGCIARDTVNLTVKNDNCLDLPSAFTPNHDGYNDTWELTIFKNLYPHAVVTIFDRRGIEVFQSEAGYPKAWDGMYKGVPLPLGSYHYVIVDSRSSLLITSGQVTILR